MKKIDACVTLGACAMDSPVHGPDARQKVLEACPEPVEGLSMNHCLPTVVAIESAAPGVAAHSTTLARFFTRARWSAGSHDLATLQGPMRTNATASWSAARQRRFEFGRVEHHQPALIRVHGPHARQKVLEAKRPELVEGLSMNLEAERPIQRRASQSGTSFQLVGSPPDRARTRTRTRKSAQPSGRVTQASCLWFRATRPACVIGEPQARCLCHPGRVLSGSWSPCATKVLEALSP